MEMSTYIHIVIFLCSIVQVQVMSANLASCFAESEWAERMREELEPYQQQYLSSDEHYTTSAELTYLTYHTNPAVQFGVVCGRTF